jgi:phosphosulfolactate phosphohydrolase-like enzyme
MYLTLIGGRAAAAAASARERSVVLVLAAEEVSRGLDDDPFASAIERAVVAALRTAERPQARPASRIDADALS